MNLVQRFQEFIEKNNLFSKKDKLLLAVSGGVDSVVLCELCNQAGYEFAIAHCNFRLRDKESERDKEFVKKLAEKYGVEFFLKEFDTQQFASENKLSIQEAARKLRYDWFRELLATHASSAYAKASADKRITHHASRIPHPASRIPPHASRLTLITAHHADDNIETLMMNFFRGTGLQGLTGIPVESPDGKICRPLLGFWKDELIQFATENKLNYVEDSSNISTKYTRNFFRHEIIPLVEKAYPEAKENLVRNIDRFNEINKLYRVSVTEIKKKLLKKKRNEIHIPIKQLMGYQNRALIYEIISDFGFHEKHVDEIIKLAESESGKYIESSSARIIKFRHWFIITGKEPAESGTILIDEGEENVQCSIFNIQFSTQAAVKHQLPQSEEIASLDADLIKFPLILRKWQTGDYFYPLGMKKKKKLARFFIDQKMSKTEKENAWVVEMNKKILWVVGQRIDDRFKVTEKTKKILQISLSNDQPG